MKTDIGGLALVFVMPMLLMFIMTMIQDAPFNDYKDQVFKAAIIDYDNSISSNKIIKALNNDIHFEVQEQDTVTLEKTIKALEKSRWDFVIVFPKGLNAEIVNSANILANEIARNVGIQAGLPHRESRDTIHVRLIFDMASKPALRLAINNILQKWVEKIQSEHMIERIQKLSNTQMDTTHTKIDIDKLLHQVSVKSEVPASKYGEISNMNSTQHNVPAWAIFGIFFISVIIGDRLIQERLGGCWTRLKLIPGNFWHILFGKMIFYVLLGFTQFVFMLLAGKYLLPLMGMPALYIKHYAMLAPVVFCICCCSSSLGILSGMFFKSTNQALPVTAITVVILSAIGGVWVPKEILPEILKTFSYFSPFSWAVAATQEIFLRDGSWSNLFIPSLVLLGSSSVMLLLAKILESKQIKN